MAKLNPVEDFWSINFDEKDPTSFNAQIAGAMKIAEKIISNPELYLAERENNYYVLFQLLNMLH